jgi:GT2 family glycosyltransferase
MIYVVVPTFNETCLVKKFIQNFDECLDLKILIVIVNANPNDSTSTLIKGIKFQRQSNITIIEIHGNHDEYWSATVNRGFKYVKNIITKDDYLVLTNIDIEFNFQIFHNLRCLLLKKDNGSILAPISTNSEGKVKSSGVKITNWLFDCKIHPFTGEDYKDVCNSEEISVDFLATRFVIIPHKAFILNFKICDELPHYAADYDYTHKFQRLGFKLYIVPTLSIKVDSGNTGLSVYSGKKSNSFERFKNLFSIKNPSNPKYRLIFISRNYPIYSVLGVALINLFVIATESLLGGKLLKSLFKPKHRGIS